MALFLVSPRRVQGQPHREILGIILDFNCFFFPMLTLFFVATAEKRPNGNKKWEHFECCWRSSAYKKRRHSLKYQPVILLLLCENAIWSLVRNCQLTTLKVVRWIKFGGGAEELMTRVQRACFSESQSRRGLRRREGWRFISVRDIESICQALVATSACLTKY